MGALPLYDFPLRPSAAIFVAPSHTEDGFLSRAGYENNRAIAGARSHMRIEFSWHQYDQGRLYSWALNNAKRARWLVEAYNTPQLATSAEIQAAEALYTRGIPFSNGQFFSTGYGFRYVPFVLSQSSALEGDTKIVVAESALSSILREGHLIGAGRSIQHIDAMDSYSGDTELQFNPPLRRDIAAGEVISLRPKMVCKPRDISSFVALFQPFQAAKPGALIMDEVVDENYV